MLLALGQSLQVEKFIDGQYIVTQGEVGTTFYFILTGTVRCYQRTKKGAKETTVRLDDWSTGAYFGEGALIQGAKRNADVVSLGEVTTLGCSGCSKGLSV